MAFDAGDDLSWPGAGSYNPTPIINEIRSYVETWRNLPNPDQWQVTPETARLLQHWRNDDFKGVQAVLLPGRGGRDGDLADRGRAEDGAAHGKFWDTSRTPTRRRTPTFRLALKLATGAGKTTVMAMLIAWQTVNAARHQNSKNFTRGFLVVTPGITIKETACACCAERPGQLLPQRELVPPDMLGDIDQAKIVITNYHAFKLRERIDVAKGSRAAIEGWRGEKLDTLETEGQMLQRVMPELMGMKNIVVLNDEAHHCYREKPQDRDDEDLKGDEKKEAEKNNEAARLWISGLEAVKRKLGVQRGLSISPRRHSSCAARATPRARCFPGR